ncbi:MAG: ring-cleaving dioxygenase [Vicinamibacterales bacterium]
MPPTILGLHHVTATVDRAQPDLDFCLDGLGLRLVKKTVNFDNHHVYHFYYGDERGLPGTLWTTFPYADRGVPVGVKGAGQVTTTSFSVPAVSLDWWRERLAAGGWTPSGGETRFGERALVVADPSGLAIELVGTDDDRRTPYSGGGVDADTALRGLHSVTMTIADPGPTVSFMEAELGWRVIGRDGRRIRLAAGADGPGHLIEILHAPDAVPARNGLGTVHHVAMAIGSAGEQAALRLALLERGVRVTEVRDRQYFQSIYFREPGGVLFEVATVGPGFTVDEPLDTLGRALKLPPWEEPHRADIERGLAPIRYRA